jgi:hypothetical protein
VIKTAFMQSWCSWNIFRWNICACWHICRALSSPLRIAQPYKKPDSFTFLLYVGSIFNHISRLVSQHNIKSVDLPPRKISGFLWLVKDDLGQKTPRVYSIPCECGQVYIGQTGHLTDTILKEHQRYIRLEHPDISAMAEHSINLGHCIQLHHATIISTKPRYMDHIIGEVIDIELHPNIMNRENGFCLSKSWRPLIWSLKDHRELPSHDGRPGFLHGHAGLCTLLLSGHKICPRRALSSLHPDYRLPSTTSAPSSPIACLQLTYLICVPDMSVLCPTHPYTFPVFFLDQQSCPFLGPS